jgi:hypothetical protein
MHRLKCDPTAKRQCRFDGYAVERHGKIGTRKLDHLCQRHRVSAVAGGTVQSFKTNEIFGNGSDGTPLAAVPNGLQ